MCLNSVMLYSVMLYNHFLSSLLIYVYTYSCHVYVFSCCPLRALNWSIKYVYVIVICFAILPNQYYFVIFISTENRLICGLTTALVKKKCPNSFYKYKRKIMLGRSI